MRAFRRSAVTAAVTLPMLGLLAACATTPTAAPTPDTDWDSLSHDELVALAEEEGTVSVYAFTSRIASSEEAFEAEYPGIVVVASDI